jgi:hypothetical protein
MSLWGIPAIVSVPSGVYVPTVQTLLERKERKKGKDRKERKRRRDTTRGMEEIGE